MYFFFCRASRLHVVYLSVYVQPYVEIGARIATSPVFLSVSIYVLKQLLKLLKLLMYTLKHHHHQRINHITVYDSIFYWTRIIKWLLYFVFGLLVFMLMSNYITTKIYVSVYIGRLPRKSPVQNATYLPHFGSIFQKWEEIVTQHMSFLKYRKRIRIQFWSPDESLIYV